ncbi:DNA cytosine methyltransferase [Stigmatella hybrida]|uniref:DNA cytosine methyltransferase n=1 Tax=Stigmatella hybrida TaxID=394097 RepID=UPI001CDAD427|nr:DNA cytosine methyltransferase [Stigmatella hybrida]
MDEIDGDDESFLRSHVQVRPLPFGGAEPLRLVDLFSGSGGLTLGAMEACRARDIGLEVRLAMELDERVQGVYDLNFPSAIKNDRGDVLSRFGLVPGQPLTPAEEKTQQEVGKIDILVGGPPCQGHSDLNNHTRRHDEKNELYMVMVRAAEVLEPRYVLIENVQGIRRDEGNVLVRATEWLDKKLGYTVEQRLVRMVDIGVPQKRIRHILVAYRGEKLPGLLDFPPIAKPRTLRWAIKDLQKKRFPAESVFDTAAQLSPENLKRARYLLAHPEDYELPNHLRPRCHRDNPTHRYRAMYGRLDWNEPAHTITTGFGSPGQGRYFHPSEPRTLTPHEAARVQFFPDWFKFGPNSNRGLLAHCIGNAVPPKLAFSVLVRLLRQHAAGASTQKPTGEAA